MQKYLTNYENYIELKQKIEKFILDEQWRYALAFDYINSKIILRDLLKMIEFFDKKPKPKNVDLFIQKTRKKCLKYLEKSKITKNIKKAWELTRIAYAYYAFIEVITEGSSYSESIINELHSIYGENYLKITSQLDKFAPSVLTNFKFETEDNKIDKNEIFDKYIILKKWQDNQHTFHHEVLYPILSKNDKEYKNYYVKKYGLNESNSRALLILENIREQSFLPIDTLAILIDIKIGQVLVSVVGGKNYGLAMLKKNGFKIPKAWIYINTNKSINKLIANLPKNIHYAVRSSALGEDGTQNSYAGLFTTVLDIPYNAVPLAIKQVNESCNSNRVKTYVDKFKLQFPKMAVVIQKYIKADLSGVWIGKDENSGILEWVSGNGDQLVSGKVKPNTEIISKSKKSSITINDKSLDNILLNYQKTIGNICDFEFCITNNELYMLQYRPVTKLIDFTKNTNNKNLIKGIPASKGFAQGEISFLRDTDEIEKFKPNTILITYHTDPDWVEIMTKAKAIVTAEGGFLCHTAIIARELDIPCVTGIGYENLDILANVKEITVDGFSGTIKINK